MMASFLSKRIDWKDFELFVADICKDAENVTLRITYRNRKTGAKRQIDACIIQTTKLHKFKIL
jgi:hypothetical protein